MPTIGGVDRRPVMGHNTGGTDAPSRLRRRTERIEDGLSVFLGVLAALAAVLCLTLASTVHTDAVGRARAEAADRSPTAAVLVTGTVTVGREAPALHHPATVRWTGHDGEIHTGHTVVPVTGPAGSAVEVWTTADDRLVPPPPAAADIWVATLAVGTIAAVLAGGALWLLAALLFRWTARCYARAWAQDWARVEPHWTGRSRP
ncbi:putative integral membrane protein [Pseudonocardia sp. Ae168_Ps1]|nr:putative integral membrane protein [Pseudonocardia sp. Ae150A_Ps1]OLL78351.1 putative integral membrane protein [Pseudonocardia sp. Ae168_Ps1]OLL92447.1 putative integral membrane protein [Pseudonocardia sp. Ae356_Ps1]